MTQLFPETVASVRLGFGRFAHFKRALREGRIPQPDVVLPDGPRWSDTTIDRWISGAIDRPAVADEAQELIIALGSKKWKRRGTSSSSRSKAASVTSGGPAPLSVISVSAKSV